MHLNFMDGNRILTEIIIDSAQRTVSIINHTDDVFERAFGTNDSPTIQDFNEFVKSRAFPYNMDNREVVLKTYDIRKDDDLQIVKELRGRRCNDDFWIDVIEE